MKGPAVHFPNCRPCFPLELQAKTNKSTGVLRGSTELIVCNSLSQMKISLFSAFIIFDLRVCRIERVGCRNIPYICPWVYHLMLHFLFKESCGTKNNGGTASKYIKNVCVQSPRIGGHISSGITLHRKPDALVIMWGG